MLSRDNPGVYCDLELDLYDDESVREVAGPWSPGLGPRQRPAVEVGLDLEAAANFVIHLLRTD
jgi:hypothetical protein